MHAGASLITTPIYKDMVAGVHRKLHTLAEEQ